MDRIAVTSKSASRSWSWPAVLGGLIAFGLGVLASYWILKPASQPARPSAPEPSGAVADADSMTGKTEKMYRAEIDRLLDVEQRLTLDLEECQLEESGAETLRQRLADLEAENEVLRANLAQYQEGLEAAVDQLNIQARAPGRRSTSTRSSPPPSNSSERPPYVAVRQPWAEIGNGVAAIDGTIHNVDPSRRARGTVILTLMHNGRPIETARVPLDLAPGVSSYEYTFRNASIMDGGGYSVTAEWLTP